MQLSLKELKEIRNNLPVESEILKKVCKVINDKICKAEIKKAEQLIKLSDETFKSLSEIFGNISDLHVEDNKPFDLNELYNIKGFYSIKTKRSELGYVEYTEITFIFDCLTEDEKKYIFNIRSKIDKTIITFI